MKSAALEAASSSTEAVAWAPSGQASSWECRAARSRQARPEEAQEPSWGTCQGPTLRLLLCLPRYQKRLQLERRHAGAHGVHAGLC